MIISVLPIFAHRDTITINVIFPAHADRRKPGRYGSIGGKYQVSIKRVITEQDQDTHNLILPITQLTQSSRGNS